ncbi:MAG: hypothetical protein ACE5G9_14100 [Nitrospinales bacterium]
MANSREDAIKLIQGLDENCSLDDIQYHLYVKQKVESGLQALDEERFLTPEEVKRKLGKWLE